MPTLFIEEITSVGAVDEGDNPKSFIELWKSKRRERRERRATQGDEAVSFDIEALSDEAREAFADLQKSVDDAAERETVLQAQVVELTPPDSKVEDVDVSKASDEVQTLVAKLIEDREADREQLATEIAKRRDQDFVNQVQKDGLVGLLGNAEEVGPVLRELADKAPEAFEKIYPAFVAAAQRTEPFLTELGASEGDPDPTAQRDAWVSKMRKEGSEKTVADLRTDFWPLHPEAVAAERENK